jgi:hypothetical protein
MLFSLFWLAIFVLDLVALVSLLKSTVDTSTKILGAADPAAAALRNAALLLPRSGQTEADDRVAR